MSEETKATETAEETLQVPVMSISQEDLEKNRLAMENAKNILTPPKGQVLAGMRSFCPVHGDITRASKIIKHTVYLKNETTGKVEPVTYSDVLCLACLSELWRTKVVANYPKDAKGNPGEIKLAPVFISEDEYKAIVKQQEEAMQKAQEEAMQKATPEKATPEKATPEKAE